MDYPAQQSLLLDLQPVAQTVGSLAQESGIIHQIHLPIRAHHGTGEACEKETENRKDDNQSIET